MIASLHRAPRLATGPFYMQRFPSKGEVVISDRSWYYRTGVEYVIGFCTEKQRGEFLKICPNNESFIVDGGTSA